MSALIRRLRRALAPRSRARGAPVEPTVYVALSQGHELTLDADERLVYVVNNLIGARDGHPKKG